VQLRIVLEQELGSHNDSDVARHRAVTSTSASAMTMAVIIHHSSLGRARTLPPWQSSSGQCPNYQPRRDSKPTRSCAPSSSMLRCSSLKAPCLSNEGLSLTSLHHHHHTRRMLRSTWNKKKQGTSPHPSMTASATITTCTMFSMCARGTRRTMLAVATTLTGAVAIIAGRTRAHLLNP
jgi:hypothetical protein